MYTLHMKEKSLSELKKYAVKIFTEYKKTGTVKWTYDIVAKDMSYQVGSLIKRIMQYRNERYADGLNKKEIKAHIADELADIITEVLFISHELDIDISQAWEDMAQSDKKKIASRSTNKAKK